jgi:hypothetical protein
MGPFTEPCKDNISDELLFDNVIVLSNLPLPAIVVLEPCIVIGNGIRPLRGKDNRSHRE